MDPRNLQSQPIPSEILSGASAAIERHLGLHFSPGRWADLKRGLDGAHKELGFGSALDCAKWLVERSPTDAQIKTLAVSLTVGETYFNREHSQMDALELDIIPSIVAGRTGGDRTLRLWSAGCATGEEPYSLAIMIDRMTAMLFGWKVFILATDINTRSLNAAMEGEYGDWSFRDTPAWLRERYFSKTAKGRFRISRKIRDMVTFQYLNLVEDSYPSLSNNTAAMDVIMCRNVLIYFKEQTIGRLVGRFHKCLVDGGSFIISATDMSAMTSDIFRQVSLQGSTIYMKPAPGEDPGSLPEPVERYIAPSSMPSWMIEGEAPEPSHRPTTKPPHEQRAKDHRFSQAHQKVDPLRQATELFGSGRYGEAVKKLEELLDREPDNLRAIELMARACANSGRLSEAIKWGEKAVAAERLNPGLHYLLATILQEAGKPDEAQASLRTVLYLDHNHLLANIASGNLALAFKRKSEAQKHFRNALKLLSIMADGEIIPGSDGMTAGRLAEIISAQTGG